MAIVKFGRESGALEGGPGVKVAKKAAKHAAKKFALKHADKHAAKKHAAKKHAEKHAAKKHAGEVREHESEGGAGAELAKAFHHLQRAGAVISLMGQESGGDLKSLYELGVEQYLAAAEPKAKKHRARAAQGILRAAEHLALGGLYTARKAMLVEVPVPESDGWSKYMGKLQGRLDRLDVPPGAMAGRVDAAARELLGRAEAAGDDMHLKHELMKAVDGLCDALEEGM